MGETVCKVQLEFHGNGIRVVLQKSHIAGMELWAHIDADIPEC